MAALNIVEAGIKIELIHAEACIKAAKQLNEKREKLSREELRCEEDALKCLISTVRLEVLGEITPRQMFCFDRKGY